jgi:pimeloyl-ACP methyl ester carboxylesterase
VTPSRRLALALSILLLLLALTAAAWQAISNHIEARRDPEPGRPVDIGGYRLQLHCTGAGSPTVVLEAGLGGLLVDWQPVQESIARFTRVCSYDRAGYGGSDPGTSPRTSARIAMELHALLARAGEPPPYVLVGHSFGGYNVRVLHGQHPDEVAAMLLVDSVQEDQYRLLPPTWNAVGAALLRHYSRQAFWAPVFIDLGVARLRLRLERVTGAWLILQSKYVKARADELASIRTSAEQARAAGSLGGKPLIVLTAGRAPAADPDGILTPRDIADYQRVWIDDLQLRLAGLSAIGKRIVVHDSGHNIPGDRPDAVVNAVRELLGPIRPPPLKELPIPAPLAPPDKINTGSHGPP